MPIYPVRPVKLCPVTVVVAGGAKSEHKDLKSAIRRYGSDSFHMSRDRKYVLRGGSFLFEGTRFQFYNGHNQLLEPSEVMPVVEEVRKERAAWSGRYSKQHVKPEHFRIEPVPNTGHRWSYRGYRHIRTTQEIRAAVAVESDEDLIEAGIHIRGSRNRAGLPTYWDEIPRTNVQKSWKNFRRTQWK